ncbi:MAG: electron transfer flavoprotein subunit alpha [Gemmatimonadetes bacterium]|nr:electron transfer flavoprotein subunit alpha [Gemmatimonadota bacterium]
MNKLFVYAEHREGIVKRASLEAIAAARDMAGDGEVTALLVGSGVDELAAGLGHHGADRVLVANDERLGRYSPTATPKVVAEAIGVAGASIYICGATAQGKDLSARVAARLDAGLASDVTALRLDGDDLLCEKPVMSGKAIGTVKVASDTVRLVTLRPNSVPALEADSNRSCAVESIATDLDDSDLHSIVTEAVRSEGGKIDVSEADIVVSGGRGITGPEHWAVLEDLADALGAAVGASRAVVDAGWVPHDIQVGQTGKVVSPGLYVAAGISGAIQHLAGMNSSKCIVAINKDPEAPIFKVADYGVVGDLFEVVPALTEAIRELGGA